MLLSCGLAPAGRAGRADPTGLQRVDAQQVQGPGRIPPAQTRSHAISGAGPHSHPLEENCNDHLFLTAKEAFKGKTPQQEELHFEALGWEQGEWGCGWCGPERTRRAGPGGGSGL